MADEAGFWSSLVRPMLLAFGTAVRIENILEPKGCPDVVYSITANGKQAAGWIELKDLDGWPARGGAPVPIHHYTPEQRQWQRKWGAIDRRIFVLVRVHGTGIDYSDDLDPVGERTPAEYFLFRATDAADGIGAWTRGDWHAMSLWHGKGTFDRQKVARHLVA